MPVQSQIITQRPEQPSDEPLLFELYASTRQEEMDAAGFPAEMRQQFLTMQFTAQRRGYASMFPNAAFQIILVNGQAAGRMVVDRTAEEIRLVDVVLLPEHRNAGLGTSLMQLLAREAAAVRKPLRLHVLRGSRAIRFYERLGYLKTGVLGIYEEMEWSAADQTNQP